MTSTESGGQDTALQVALLESSFEKVKPYADQFVPSFYENLFTDAPAAQPLFAHTNMDEQGKKLLASLVFVVENLRRPGELTNALKGLGARHVQYGALPAHYPLVGAALLKTFEQYLKDDWTPEVKQAWVDAYGLITEVMLDGADYSPEVVQLPEPEAPTSPDTAETTHTVELLEQSFEKVKPYAAEFTPSFYDNLFTDSPAAKPLFAHTNMEKQGKMLLNSLVFVVENLRKPEELSTALKGLGARHVKYGALPEHYPLVGAALLKTFEQYLKDDWTPEVKQAWVEAYGMITEAMLDGADYSPADVALPTEPEAAPAAVAEPPAMPTVPTEPEPAAPEVDEATGLKVALLEESFEKVKPYAAEFTPSFYDTLFTDSPAAKPLFAHTNMEKQGKMLLDSLVFVVENLRRPGELTGALKGLGTRHVKYGALPEHYPLVGSALLKTFEQYLKEDWTPETKQAWVEAYGLITEVMLDGADYSKAEVALPPDPAPAPEPVAAPPADPSPAPAPEATAASMPQPEDESSTESAPPVGLIGGGVVGILLIILLILAL